MKQKTLLVISDLHSGHLAGLTPPDFQLKPAATITKRNKWVKIQRALWREYTKTIKLIGSVDVLLVNGDCIDGRAEKSGGVEVWSANRDEQCDAAIRCIEEISARKIIMTFGTGYHVSGSGEDYEMQIADALHNVEKIGAHEWFSINGCVFDAKHHISDTTAPHLTPPLGREAVWNQLWNIRNEQPLADVVIRSHIHRHFSIQTADYCAMTTPALQGMGSIFGSRRCSKIVDWGMILFRVRGKHDYDIERHIIKVPEQRTEVLEL